MEQPKLKYSQFIQAGTAVLTAVALVLLALGFLSDDRNQPEARGVTNFDSLTLSSDLVVGNDASVAGDLAVTGALATTGDLAVINQALGTENVGVLPTIVSTDITTETTGALFTVADGEVWFVWDVIINVTEDFDCTGNDCVLTVGDGNDPNGFLDLVDAELQAADTQTTGFAAGWQGLGTDTRGVYLNEATTNGYHPFVYAPSGAAETIDLVIGGTDPVAGAATIYVIYTRIQ